MVPGIDIGEWDHRLAFLWRWSNLKFVGFYLAHHAMQKRTTWTTHWHDLRDLGWTLVPFWVPFTGKGISKMKTTDGTVHGRFAVDRAHEAGLQAGAAIYLDSEAAVLGGSDDHAYAAYMINWMQAVRQAGFSTGIYCSRLDTQRILTGQDFRPLRPNVWPFAIPIHTRALWNDATYCLTPATPRQWIVQTKDSAWVDNVDAVGCQYDWFRKDRDRQSITWPAAGGDQGGSTDADFDSARISDPTHPLASVAFAIAGDQGQPDLAHVFSVSALELDHFDRTPSGGLSPVERFAHSPADIGPDPAASSSGFDTGWMASVSRRPGFFDGFVTGQDGFIRQFWLNPDERFPTHASCLNPAMPTRKGTPIVAISRRLDQLDLFYVDQQHLLTTRWWNPGESDWTRNVSRLDGPPVSGGSNLVALPSQHDAMTVDRMDVFYVSCEIAASEDDASWSVAHAFRSAGDGWRVSSVPNTSGAAGGSGVAAVRASTGAIHMIAQRRDRSELMHLILEDGQEIWQTSTTMPKRLPSTLGRPDWWMCLYLIAIADALLLFGITRNGALAWSTLGSAGWSEINSIQGPFSSGRPVAYARRGATNVDIVGVTNDGVPLTRTLQIGPDSLNSATP
ncbi:glycoside hydrolase domain-containing protein [Mesorhizobium intechi]|uniref:glycoside hydrolase domain-containing protein n=1 Tax=Mesorhizobium intechi TaxID=537601 RepID=UPI00142EC649|nr:glycoside hydrolase domain-containing protein [Mesorhizobium intechi]